MAEDLTRTQSGGEGQTEQIVKPEVPKAEEYKPIKVDNNEPQDVPLEKNIVNEHTGEKIQEPVVNDLASPDEEIDTEPVSPLLREGDVPVEDLKSEEDSLSSDLTFFNDSNQPKNPNFYVEQEDPYLSPRFADSELVSSIKQDINNDDAFQNFEDLNENANLNLDFNIKDPNATEPLNNEEQKGFDVNKMIEDESEGVDPELPTPPKRDGFMKNEDGTVSTHKMRAEQLEDGSWVAFPSLFQNEDGSWVDMSNEEDWMNTYLEAEKRGEVIPFGDDKQSALDYGKGNWKGDEYISDQTIESNKDVEGENVFSDKTEEELDVLLDELKEENKKLFISNLAKETNKTIEQIEEGQELEKYNARELKSKNKMKNLTNEQNPFFYSGGIDLKEVNERGLFKKKVWINPFPSITNNTPRERLIAIGQGDIKRGKTLMRVFKEFFITDKELERHRKKYPKSRDRDYINSKYQDLIEGFNITPKEFSYFTSIMDGAMGWKNNSIEGVKKTVKLPAGNLHKFVYKPWGQSEEFNIDPDKYEEASVQEIEEVAIPFTFELAWRKLQVSDVQLGLIKRAYNKKGKPFSIKTFKTQRMLATTLDEDGDPYYIAEGGIYNHGLTGSSNKNFRNAYKRFREDKARKRIRTLGEAGDGKGTKKNESERLKFYGTKKEIPWADASNVDEIEEIAIRLGVKDTRMSKPDVDNKVEELLFKNGELASPFYFLKKLQELFPEFSTAGSTDSSFGSISDITIKSPSGVVYSFDDLKKNYKDGLIQQWFFNNQNSHLDNIKEEWNHRYDPEAYNLGLASKTTTNYLTITTNRVKNDLTWRHGEINPTQRGIKKYRKKEGATMIVGPDGRNHDVVNDMLNESLNAFDAKSKEAEALGSQWKEISGGVASKFQKAKSLYDKNRKYYKVRRDAILMDIDQDKVSLTEGQELIEELNSNLNSSANEYKTLANTYKSLIQENEPLINKMNSTQEWLEANQSSLYKNMKNFEHTVAFNQSVRENTATDNIFVTVLSGALEGVADVYEAIAMFATDIVVEGVKLTNGVSYQEAQNTVKKFVTGDDKTGITKMLLGVKDGDPRSIQAQTSEISKNLADFANVKILPEGLEKMSELYQGYFAVSQSVAAMMVPTPFKGGKLLRTTKGGRKIIKLSNGKTKFLSDLPFRQRAAINLRTKMHLNFNMSAMMYSGYRAEIENDPELSKMSTASKNFFAVPTSIVVGALENLGLKSMNLLKGGSSNFLKTVFSNTLKQSPKTSKQFHNLLLSETEKLYLSITSKMATPLLAEGITEAAQVLPEVGMRSLWNNYVLGSDLFSNPDTSEELAGMMYQNFKLGVYGATGMSSVTGGVNFLLKQMRGEKSDYTFSQEDYDILSLELNKDDAGGKSLKQYYASLYQAKELSREEALNRIKSVNKFVEIESNINALGDDFSKEQRKELVDLYIKKIAIQSAYEKSKDVNLSTLISGIDKQIMSISQGEKEVDTEQKTETKVEQRNVSERKLTQQKRNELSNRRNDLQSLEARGELNEEQKNELKTINETLDNEAKADRDAVEVDATKADVTKKELTKKDELNQVSSEMKKLAPKYKEAEGEEKTNILNNLKELTAKKKQLEADIIQEQIDVIDKSINPESGSKPSGLELEVLEEEKQNLITKKDNLIGEQTTAKKESPVKVVNQDGNTEIFEDDKNITVEKEGPKTEKQKIFSEVLGREVEREVPVKTTAPEVKEETTESLNVSTKINQEKSQRLGGEARDIIVDGKVVGTVMGNENASGDFEVQDVDVDESLQGQGIGTQVYEQLNKEKKGQKVVSSGAFVENEAGVKPGEKLWNKLVKEGKAVKNENGNFEMISEESQKKSTTEKAPVTGKSDEETTTKAVEKKSEDKQEAPVKKLSIKELEKTGKVKKGNNLYFIDPQNPNKKIRLKVKQTGKTNETTVKFERNKNVRGSDTWYAYSEENGTYVAFDKSTNKEIQSLELAPIKPKAEKTTKVKGKRGRKAKTAEQLIEERTNLEKELNDIRPIDPKTGKRKGGRLSGKAKERQIEINKKLDSIEGLLEKRSKEKLQAKKEKAPVEQKKAPVKKDVKPVEKKVDAKAKVDKKEDSPVEESKKAKELKQEIAILDSEIEGIDQEIEGNLEEIAIEKGNYTEAVAALKSKGEQRKADRLDLKDERDGIIEAYEEDNKELKREKKRAENRRKKLTEKWVAETYKPSKPKSESTSKETPAKEEKTPVNKNVSKGKLSIEGVSDGYKVYVGDPAVGDTRGKGGKDGLRETIKDGKKIFTLSAPTRDSVGRLGNYSISLTYPADTDVTLDDVSGKLEAMNKKFVDNAQGEMTLGTLNQNGVPVSVKEFVKLDKNKSEFDFEAYSKEEAKKKSQPKSKKASPEQIAEGKLSIAGSTSGFTQSLGRPLVSSDTRRLYEGFREDVIGDRKIFSKITRSSDIIGRKGNHTISLAYPADTDVTLDDVKGHLEAMNKKLLDGAEKQQKEKKGEWANPETYESVLTTLSLKDGSKVSLEKFIANDENKSVFNFKPNDVEATYDNLDKVTGSRRLGDKSPDNIYKHKEEKIVLEPKKPKKTGLQKTIETLRGFKTKNWTEGDGGAALSTIPGLPQAFDLAVEAVIAAVKGGAKIVDLSKAVVAEFKKTKYYKNLPKGTKRDHVRKVKNLLDERQKQAEREAQTKERKRVEKRDRKREIRKRYRGTTYDREEGDGVEGKRQKSEGTKRRTRKKGKVTSKNVDGMLDPESYTDEVFIQDKIDEAFADKDDSKKVTTTEKAQYIMLLKNHEIGAKAGSKAERKAIKTLQGSLVKLTNSLFSNLKTTRRERERLIKKIKNANTKKQYDKAVREVENLAKKIIEKEVTKIVTDPKTLRKKYNQKWNKGKVSGRFRDIFNNFVSKLDPVEDMSLEEIIAVKNQLNSLIKAGKFELEEINREKKRRRRRTDGTLIQAIKKPLKMLNNFTEISDFFNYKGAAEQAGVKAGSGIQRVIVINGEYMTKTEFEQALKNGELNEADFEGRKNIAKGYEKSDSKSKTNKQKIIGSKIKRLGRAILSISATVRGIEQIHNKIINKTLSEDIRKTLRAFGNNLSLAPKRILDISNDKTDLFNKKMKEALGLESDSVLEKGKKVFSKDSYSKFLDSLSEGVIGSGKSLFLEKENGESFMDRDINKSEIVQLYLLSKNGDKVKNSLISKDGVNFDAIEEFMNENKDLKKYADTIIDFFNSDMKDFIEPVYQYYFDLGVPTMKPGDFYYPVSRDISSQDNSGTLYQSLKDTAASNNADGSMKSEIGNAITSPLNERVTNASAKINWEMISPHDVVSEYIENVARADVMRETVEQASSVLNPFYQAELETILGERIYEDYRELVSRIVSGKNMFKGQDSFNKGINVLTNITAVKTLAFRAKAIVQQAASTINYTGAGLKHGVNPLEIWGVRYKGDKKGFKVFSDNYKKVSTRLWNSGYRKYRTSQGGGQEIEVKRMLDKISATGDVNMLRKAINHYVKIGMLPIAVGDILAASYMPGGGFSFATALYEKAIRDGKSEEQALQFAEDQWYRETEAAQQYSLDETLKSRLTYNAIHRLLIPFSSSQRSYVGKWVRARQVLTGSAYGAFKGKNPYTKEEVYQAAWDIWFYPLFSNATFTAVSGGYGYYYLKDAIAAALGDDEDDWVDDSAEKRFMDKNGYIKLGPKKLKYKDGKWYDSKGNELNLSLGDKESLSRRMKYFLAMETVQSSLQGIGVPGALANIAINNARGRFQTSSGNPTVDLIKDLYEPGKNILFSDKNNFTKTKDWALLSKTERKQFKEMGITKEEFNKPLSNIDSLPFLSWDKLTSTQRKNWGDLVDAIGLKNVLKLAGVHPTQNNPQSIAKEQSFVEETLMGTLPLTDKNSFMYMNPDNLFKYFYNEDIRQGLTQSGGIRAGTKKMTLPQEDTEMVFDENTGVSRPRTKEEMREFSEEKLKEEEEKEYKKEMRPKINKAKNRRKRIRRKTFQKRN